MSWRDDNVIERLRRQDDVVNDISDNDFENVIVDVELYVLNDLSKLDGALHGAALVTTS